MDGVGKLTGKINLRCIYTKNHKQKFLFDEFVVIKEICWQGIYVTLTPTAAFVAQYLSSLCQPCCK